MSFWIHAFCNENVPLLTPAELKNGIANRLKLLTYLFCPQDEEDPDLTLSRLRIENLSQDEGFQTFLLHYRPESATFIRMDRNDRAAVDELEQELLAHRNQPRMDRVRQMLSKVTEDVSFCLKAHDVHSMGFPLAIAAAAFLVEQKGGLIQSGTYSWMVPSGKEVRTLLEFDA